MSVNPSQKSQGFNQLDEYIVLSDQEEAPDLSPGSFTFKKGFTLIEVTFACLVTSVVALALYSTLSRGIDVWRRVHEALPQEDIAIFFEKVADDLENSFVLPGVEFAGNQTHLSFATFVARRAPETGVKEIGAARYLFDASGGEVRRAHLTYSGLYEEREPRFSTMLAGARDCSFAYFFFNKDEERYMWGPQWPPVDADVEGAALPLAVRLLVKVEDDRKTQEYTKTIFLPLAESPLAG